MKRYQRALTAGVLMAVAASGDAAVIASTGFDTGLEGWTTSPGSPLAFSWQPSGGNPGGYIRYDDNREGPGEGGSSIFAPAQYLGNWTEMGVSSFSFEFNVFSTGRFVQAGNHVVVIEGPAGKARWTSSQVDAGIPWRSLEAQVVEGEWDVVSGIWEEILLNVTEMRLSQEAFNSLSVAEITGVDNPRLFGAPPASAVPAPGTAPLMAIAGLVGGITCRRDLYSEIARRSHRAT